VIAQTIIWYYRGFGGRPGQIVEFDMTFEENFAWGLDGTLTVMDVGDITKRTLDVLAVLFIT